MALSIEESDYPFRGLVSNPQKCKNPAKRFRTFAGKGFARHQTADLAIGLPAHISNNKDAAMNKTLYLKNKLLNAFLACLVLGLLAASLGFSDDPELRKVPVGAVAAQLTGRLVGGGGLAGEYEFLCYATFIEGLGASLFSGNPSEQTALITLRSDKFRFQTLANGSLIHFGRLILPGTPLAQVRVYYTSNPSHDFSDPDSFSQGQLVGALQARGIQGDLTPSFTFNASGTLTVESTSDISIGGKRVSLRVLGNSVTASLRGVAPSAAQFTGANGISVPLDGTVYSSTAFRDGH